MSQHSLELRRDDGTLLAIVDTLTSATYAIVANDVAPCTLVLPWDYNPALLVPDNRIDIWRAPDNGAPSRQRIYFLRYLEEGTDEDGNRAVIVKGYDQNYLLTSRIVAYDAGTPYTEKTGYADDIMKAIVRENMSTLAVDTARQISSTYLSVEPDLSLGPTLTKITFPRKNVLNALQAVAEAARTAGTPVYFDLVAIDDTQLQFRTYINQPGVDHTSTGIAPVSLGMEHGNMVSAKLVRDWSQEFTYVYAGGSGTGTARRIITAESTARSGRSLFGRREEWYDRSNLSLTTTLTVAAYKRLAEGRPRLQFSGKLSGEGYGTTWRWGDKLPAVYNGQEYVSVIRAVTVRLDEDGNESIDGMVEYTE
mgnify:FL=1